MKNTFHQVYFLHVPEGGSMFNTPYWKKKSDKEDIYPGTSQVPSSSTETFSEGPHHDVNVFGIHTKVVHYPLPMRAQGTYTVCLVQVNIRLVLLF